MKRAAAERMRTWNVWREHLRRHRVEGSTLACECEFQMGRFRKGQRLGGCGNPRCWLCHSGKLGHEPTPKELRSMETFKEGLKEALLANISSNRTGRHRGRAVLAIDGVLGGAQAASGPAG